MNNVICSGCGHTTKPGLVNEDGLCPVCATPDEENGDESGEEEN